MIHFQCPYCNKAIKVRDEAAGRTGKCLGCGKTIQVPQSAVLIDRPPTTEKLNEANSSGSASSERLLSNCADDAPAEPTSRDISKKAARKKPRRLSNKSCGKSNLETVAKSTLIELEATDNKEIGGDIAYYGLQEWWQTAFTPGEQEHIVAKFFPLGMGGSNNLITGHISSNSQSAVNFLRSLSTWFNNKADRHLEKRILDKAVEIGGEFWFHKVGRLKTEGCSDAVILECTENIPYPAAFREIAVAIRKDIRARRKENADSNDLLKELYKWAVVESFFGNIEWGQILNERMLHSTAQPWIKGIKAAYDLIGYANLGLLNKTDIKWLVEAFGEPTIHSTAREANPDLWQRAVDAFQVAAKNDERLFWRAHGFDNPP